MTTESRWRRKPPRHMVAMAAVAVALAFAMTWFVAKRGGADIAENTALSGQPKKQPNQPFSPTPAQWATLTFETVGKQVFRAGRITEGKIAVDEDRSTPIFSPYAGRVTKLLARPGDVVVPGQPLFMIEAADMVQAQTDFIAAVTAGKQG